MIYEIDLADLHAAGIHVTFQAHMTEFGYRWAAFLHYPNGWCELSKLNWPSPRAAVDDALRQVRELELILSSAFDTLYASQP